MKKAILIAFVATLVIPQVAFASWWNPLSWFDNWHFNRDESKTETLEARIQELESKLQGSENLSETGVQIKEDSKTQKQPVKDNNSTKPSVVQPMQIDFCTNIDGVQVAVPEGYAISNYFCTKIIQKDYCPNIDGIQTVTPVGTTLYSSLGKCLTDAEFDEIDQKQKQTQSCLEQKERVVELNEEIIDTKNFWEEKISIAQTNPGGSFGGALQSQINQLTNQMWDALNPIYDQLTITQSKVGLYCSYN